MSGQPVCSHELISVVIPAYNAQHTLLATLDSVFAQTWPRVEVIVVDDGSTDHTGALLQALGSRVRAIRQPNGGLAQARRTGVEAAQGHWIALMDADDLCRPDRLAVQAQVMRACPQVVLCGSNFGAFDDRTGETHPHHAIDYYAMLQRQGLATLLPQETQLTLDPSEATATDGTAAQVRVRHGTAYRPLAHGNFLHPPTLMFRRTLIDRIGNFDPEARSMCDWDWIVRAASVGEVAFVERELIDYRLSPTQMSSPRHRVRATLDTLLVAERICQRDPELYLAELPRFLHDLGFYCADAADALVETDRRRAFQLVMRSITRFSRIDAMTLRVLAKVLTPTWALTALRHRRAAHSG
jgi:glycosyltransferase involved in cell wall biosynthesis